MISNKHQGYLNLWASGQLFAFSGIDGSTDYSNGLCARISPKYTGIEIVFPGVCDVVFGEQVCKAEFSGDFFDIQTESKRIKGVFSDAHNMLIEGDCEIQAKSDLIEVHKAGSISLISSKGFADQTLCTKSIDDMIDLRKQWWGTCEIPEGLSAGQKNAYRKALSMSKSQIYTPEGKMKRLWSTPDRWPHRDMWLWDSAFHAIGWRHLNINIAKQLLEAVFDVQEDDGMISHQASPYHKSAITQPPVLALAAKKIYEMDGDIEWVRNIYPLLCRYIEWDIKNRDVDGGGLLEWYIHEDEMCRSGESGMDNSPRFDCAKAMDAVDFNSFLALECEILSHFAGELGFETEQEKWAKLWKKTCGLINARLWDDEKKFYVDCISDTGEKIDVMAGAGFLPLLCGAATAEQAQCLVDHLDNEKTFKTEVPIASIAACDESYSKDMWRGPMWVNLNWLVIEGLNRYGLTEKADMLTQRTLGVIEEQYEKYGSFFEFYDDRGEVDPPKLLRKQTNNPEIWTHQVIHDFGWTASLYIDFLNR